MKPSSSATVEDGTPRDDESIDLHDHVAQRRRPGSQHRGYYHAGVAPADVVIENMSGAAFAQLPPQVLVFLLPSRVHVVYRRVVEWSVHESGVVAPAAHSTSCRELHPQECSSIPHREELRPVCSPGQQVSKYASTSHEGTGRMQGRCRSER
jgi:hypothetical protein